MAFLANYTSPITNETEQIEKLTPSGGDAAAAFAGGIKQTYASLLSSTEAQAGAFRIWAASGSRDALHSTRTQLIISTASRDVDTANAFIGGLGNNATLVVVNEGENDSADSLTPHVRPYKLPGHSFAS